MLYIYLNFKHNNIHRYFYSDHNGLCIFCHLQFLKTFTFLWGVAPSSSLKITDRKISRAVRHDTVSSKVRFVHKRYALAFKRFSHSRDVPNRNTKT